MNHLKQLYQHSLSLLTDLYQLTMAYGYWKSQKTHQHAVFTLFFRKPPFNSGYTIAAGLRSVVDYLDDLHFTETDLDYLASLKGVDDKPLFEQEFLDYLYQLRFNCDIDALPEGTLVFPQEPLLRVQGPLLQCQLLETILLNLINFQTLTATKAARICQAAQGQAVLEFGLRRAQGIDGALMASRSAYIGGCVGTSNVLAGKLYGIPVRGTHAHSWVMSFEQELEAFQTYAQALPNNCIFLVDTYDTRLGVRHALQVAHTLRENGHQFLGIRLDSGDLVVLSQQARKMLDEAGFQQAQIVGSSDLDEYLITQLKQAGAMIDVWGVGTKLITSYDHPALGGVYKLSALRKVGEAWQPRLKLSEEVLKTSNPGLLQVRRFYRNNHLLGDMLYDESHPPQYPLKMLDPNTGKHMTLEEDSSETLLIPILRQGRCVAHLPSLEAIRVRVQQQLNQCPESLKRLYQPEHYPVYLEENLYNLKQHLIKQAQQMSRDELK